MVQLNGRYTAYTKQSRRNTAFYYAFLEYAGVKEQLTNTYEKQPRKKRNGGKYD